MQTKRQIAAGFVTGAFIRMGHGCGFPRGDRPPSGGAERRGKGTGSRTAAHAGGRVLIPRGRTRRLFPGRSFDEISCEGDRDLLTEGAAAAPSAGIKLLPPHRRERLQQLPPCRREKLQQLKLRLLLSCSPLAAGSSSSCSFSYCRCFVPFAVRSISSCSFSCSPLEGAAAAAEAPM